MMPLSLQERECLLWVWFLMDWDALTLFKVLLCVSCSQVCHICTNTLRLWIRKILNWLPIKGVLRMISTLPLLTWGRREQSRPRKLREHIPN